MNSLKSLASRAILKQQRSLLRQTSRRSASNSSHHSTHPVPESESFGRGFYLLLAALPTTYIVYNLSQGDNSDSWVKKLTDKYNEPNQTWVERNALHTRMVEQAGHDRNLFLNSSTPNSPDLKFPEHVSAGSPYNVPAGHYANLDKLVAHYQEKHTKEEEEKLQLMREGQLPAQLRAKEEEKRAAALLASATKAAGKGA